MTDAKGLRLSRRRLDLLEKLLREEGFERAPARTVPPRPDPDAPVPLTFPQRRIWFLDRLAGRTSAYVISAALRVRGPFSPETFTRACQEVVRRHETLRTVFFEAGGHPYQRVRADLTADVRVVDLRGRTAERAEDEIMRREAELVERPFDLTTGPLLRVEVLRLADQDTALLLTMHHLVGDRWSMGVLMRELTGLYGAYAAGAPTGLPELPIQYGDFAAWQQNSQVADAWAEDIAYWTRQLAGAPVDAGLAVGRPRPKEKTYRGSSVPVELPPSLVARLRELAGQEGATLFMVLAAAVKILIQRLGGGTDVVIGTPIAGRTSVELEPLIGLFVNTLALRTDLGGDPSFRELLRRVAAVCLKAYQHQNVPFDKLVEALPLERSLALTPVFQVLLSYQNVPFPSWDHGAVTIEPIPLEAPKAEFDLLFDLFEDGDARAGGSIWGRLEYSTDLFTSDDARRIARALVEVLRTVAEDPDRRIGELPIADEAECVVRGPARRWCDDEVSPETGPGPVWAHEYVAWWARRTPDAVAVRFDGESLGYAELERRAELLARRLRRAGVGPGTLVRVPPGRTADAVVRLIAVLKAGAVHVAPDFAGDAAPDDAVFDLGLDIGLDGVLDSADEDDLGGGPGVTVTGEDLACVVGDSEYTHEELRNLLLWMRDEYRVTSADRVLGNAPLTADASLWETLLPLVAGATLVVAGDGGGATHGDAFGDRRLVELIRREKITTAHFLPSRLAALLREPGLERCLSLKRVICGGEPLPAEVRDRFFTRSRARLHTLYGSWAAWTCTRDRTPGPVPIGTPIANTTVYVLDERLRPVPAGMAGQVHVVVRRRTTPQGARGTRGDRGDRLVPNPFDPGTMLYRTGDLGRVRDDGVLEYLGRLDRHVRLRGFLAHLGDIEAALLGHERVNEAFVVVRRRGPVAYVTGDAPPDAAELTAYLRERLPDYMIPVAFVVLPAPPRTRNGKVDLAALPDVELATGGPKNTFVAPRDDLERGIAEIWRDILGVERVGVHDDFFQLGGHSLLATRLAARIAAEHGVEFPLRKLFDNPTVAGIAAGLAEAGAGARQVADPIHVVDRSRPLPLSFAQERLLVHHPVPADDAHHNVPTALVLTGRLDQPALRRALDALVRRHETLRTRFVTTSSGWSQIVDAHGSWPLSVVDVRDADPGDADARVRAIVDAESRRPFAIDAEHLVRGTLIVTAADQAVLVLVMHHLVTDNWSYGVLVRDLCELYMSEALGREPRLPELPVGFADVVAWQRRRLATGAADEQVDYWRRRLSGLPAVPALAAPDDFATGPDPAGDEPITGYRRSFILDADVTDALNELARASGATLFMVLVAAYGVLLAEALGRDEAIVAFPEAGRERPETANLVGYLVNDLVVRVDVSGAPAFGELIKRVREDTLDAHDRRGVPLWSVDGVMSEGSDPFRHRFNLLNAPIPAVDLPELHAEPLKRAGDYVFSEVTADIRPGEADLALIMREHAGRLRGMWLWDPGRVDPKAVAGLIRRWPHLVAALATDPDRPVTDAYRSPAGRNG
ncbi:condensation domain-containing protein [Thermopolyspora sp. NPDC052614]|uniref:condensation domain-containing protein n=1 Tax=Thermopolyspora sp. NPDC052614 TaxID=3155682 RepID=UPI0034473711